MRWRGNPPAGVSGVLHEKSGVDEGRQERGDVDFGDRARDLETGDHLLDEASSRRRPFAREDKHGGRLVELVDPRVVRGDGHQFVTETAHGQVGRLPVGGIESVHVGH